MNFFKADDFDYAATLKEEEARELSKPTVRGVDGISVPMNATASNDSMVAILGFMRATERGNLSDKDAHRELQCLAAYTAKETLTVQTPLPTGHAG